MWAPQKNEANMEKKNWAKKKKEKKRKNRKKGKYHEKSHEKIPQKTVTDVPSPIIQF